MSRVPKERFTATMDADLLARVDSIAEVRNESRSTIIERIIRNGIEQQEEFVNELGGGGGLAGALTRVLFHNPKLQDAILKAVSDDMELEVYQERLDHYRANQETIDANAKEFRKRSKAQSVPKRKRSKREGQDG